MDLNKLDEPFPTADIEWRVQSCGVTSNGKPWAMVLAYVTNRAIMKRLDDVCGKAFWRNEFLPAPDSGVMCGISIKVEEEWITKWDAAENTQVEAVKGGMSGAMKRAAVQWGIGRYLYSLEEGFAEVSLEKRNGWNRASTKDKKTIYWTPPTLPAWALPLQKNDAVVREVKGPDVGRGFDKILADFTAQASDCLSSEELKSIYTATWNALAESSNHQTKCIDVFKHRNSELKKAA
ncbi:Rad52/Rad22 family DNA repair protein [Yersinia mollaretii]|uniref:Rad52/Rad22 family DNA repair protein n=1 Tax=Yersinia mollaretii TaxID=33060 RepID=UPI000C14D564|nr:Rad52/Rad22 family DNA repair protein [Yersinia mollaretii]MDA5529074.1 Rad52/Rad22 family DNA repair protein [Yersinia mollaretii]MDR7875767.1 Rad52/Rad22 family DNA repair protein [Yersinia mollaretii]PHZ29597.1 recombinase [Yersinia mollaretii]WQC76889.1 Rad52/Rad22 family DNA repair protein [Yersinia mollaretii]